MTTLPEQLPLNKDQAHPTTAARQGPLSRLDLVHRLNAGVQGKLTTLTNLSQPQPALAKAACWLKWIQESAWPVYWLSLDEHDNDVVVFLRYLISSLQGHQPDIGAATLEILQAPEPPNAETTVRLLVNQLAELQEDLVLVLDDFHVIINPAIFDCY